ncbi:MAG: DUF1015 family protein [Bacteroidota bacterium]
MAVLHPFRALRPVPDVVEEVACVPYDVINTDEARSLAAGKPLSFLHVIRPEIGLPPGTDLYSEAVYAQGAESLARYADSASSIQEDAPTVYVYRLVMNGRAQTGLFGCVSVAEYDENRILKHELTRPTKEDDRTRHLLAQQAHAEPVMLTYRDDARIDTLVASVMQGAPLYDFTASDGVQHTLWAVDEPARFVEAFREVDRLYVADGHHRCKAASRAAAELGAGPNDEAAYFPAVLFPMGQMEILPYNRIIRTLAGMDLLPAVQARMAVMPTNHAEPDEPGVVGLYTRGRWYRAVLPPTQRVTVADHLDVARLQEHLLAPILGITKVRTDPNIDFVGGIRGLPELERLVDDGEAALAIAMYPTHIDDLVAVSDAGLLMPPKSTWFEPKLRSGLLVHRF